MQLQNKKILIAAQFAAPYEGNFIASLRSLEHRLKNVYNAECAYLFPHNAATKPWAEQFRAEHKSFFSGSDTSLISDCEASEILEEFAPDLIYTHFEGYDLPLHRAVKQSRKTIREVWHMHDALSFQRNPAKALYQTWCYFKHYGIPAWGG